MSYFQESYSLFSTSYSRFNSFNADELIGRAFAFCLLLLLSPFFIVLALGLLVTQGRPLFYSGTRIGLDGIYFTIYKFRTMKINAEKELNGVVCKSVTPITPMGRFLRVCRLDELPQLWNVCNGTMTWVGPRPMRESVFRYTQAAIPHYYKRLWVKPGLFGPTQVFFPHGTDKRIRFLFYCLSFFGTRPWNRLRKLELILITSKTLILKSLSQAASAIKLVYVHGTLCDRRRGTRVQPRTASHIFDLADIGREIIRADEYMFLLKGDIMEFPDEGTVTMTIPGKRNPARRKARCSLKVYKTKNLPDGNVLTLVHYTPLSGNARFIIDRYLLGKSIL